MKSLLVSIMWPAWEWTVDPTIRSIHASYSKELSFDFSDKHRAIINSDWWKGTYPEIELEYGAETKSKFRNNKGGIRISGSVGSGVTGKHANRLVFDDLAKAQDAYGRSYFDPVAIKKANNFWFKAMASRAADPSKVRRVGVMQRLHMDDTAGICIERGYDSLILPVEFDGKHRSKSVTGWRDPRKDGEVLWPERFTPEYLAGLKIDLSTIDWASQYGCEPVQPGGNIYREDWFRVWGKSDSIRHKSIPQAMYRVQTWDCTFSDTKSSDYVSGTLWGIVDADVLLLEELAFERLSFTDTCDAIKKAYNDHPDSSIIIESKANGPGITNVLSSIVPGIIPFSPDKHGNKEQRANAVQPVVKAGNVFVPCPKQNPWVQEWISNMTKFPFARFDDQVDGFTQLMLYLRDGSFRLLQSYRKM